MSVRSTLRSAHGICRIAQGTPEKPSAPTGDETCSGVPIYQYFMAPCIKSSQAVVDTKSVKSVCWSGGQSRSSTETSSYQAGGDSASTTKIPQTEAIQPERSALQHDSLHDAQHDDAFHSQYADIDLAWRKLVAYQAAHAAGEANTLASVPDPAPSVLANAAKRAGLKRRALDSLRRTFCGGSDLKRVLKSEADARKAAQETGLQGSRQGQSSQSTMPNNTAPRPQEQGTWTRRTLQRMRIGQTRAIENTDSAPTANKPAGHTSQALNDKSGPLTSTTWTRSGFNRRLALRPRQQALPLTAN